MKQPLLGIHVAELRNKKGMTQKDLATACNVDIRTIQRIEAGEVLPRVYTLKLLATALEDDMTGSSNKSVEKDAWLTKQIRWSFLAGIIFSINYIPVIFHFVVHPFGSFIYGALIVIHILSCILFLRAFYLLGRRFDNQFMAIPSFLGMILLPLLNVMEIFKGSYSGIIYMIYALACINALVYGVGLLIESTRKVSGIYLYRITGIIALIQSTLLLSSNHDTIVIGLIMSMVCNIFQVLILYKESKGIETRQIKKEDIPALA